MGCGGDGGRRYGGGGFAIFRMPGERRSMGDMGRRGGEWGRRIGGDRRGDRDRRGDLPTGEYLECGRAGGGGGSLLARGDIDRDLPLLDFSSSTYSFLYPV